LQCNADESVTSIEFTDLEHVQQCLLKGKRRNYAVLVVRDGCYTPYPSLLTVSYFAISQIRRDVRRIKIKKKISELFAERSLRL